MRALSLSEPGAEVLFLSPACVDRSRLPVPALVTPFRACELCAHSTAHAGGLLCGSPAARLSGEAEPLEVARSVCGSCGPSARHLDMQTWR